MADDVLGSEESFVRRVLNVFAAGGLLAVMSGSAAEAAIIELTMSTPVNAVTHTEVTPYLAPGDIATLTVRYDTDSAATAASGASALYQNAITYFGFEIERGGVTTYSGSISGNFGQISVADQSGAAVADIITFRIFDTLGDYPGATRAGTTLPPDLPLMSTGDPVYGDLLFHDFRLHFMTVDNTVLSSASLPSLAALTIAGGGSPFGPHNGNTPWSGQYQSENWRRVLGGFGSFGPGAPRAGQPYPISYSVREYNGGGVSEVPLPAAAPLFGLGLAGLAGFRRRRARNRG